jgi:hypothetical protein
MPIVLHSHHVTFTSGQTLSTKLQVHCDSCALVLTTLFYCTARDFFVAAWCSCEKKPPTVYALVGQLHLQCFQLSNIIGIKRRRRFAQEGGYKTLSIVPVWCLYKLFYVQHYNVERDAFMLTCVNCIFLTFIKTRIWNKICALHPCYVVSSYQSLNPWLIIYCIWPSKFF